MDFKYLGFRAWKRLDVILLLVFAGICVGVVFLVPHLPGVGEYYQKQTHLSAEAKSALFVRKTCWNLSWVIGWEFMFRYFLLRLADGRWPRYGWLLAPVLETAYHLSKPPLEAVGMFAFAAIMTYYVKRRGIWLLPFLVHLAIEESLWYMLLFA